QAPSGGSTQGPIQTFGVISPTAKAAPTPPPVYVAPLTDPLNPSAGWTNSQFEPSIAVNPRNPNQIFLVGANEGTIENTGGLFTAYSTDGGQTWTQRLIASGPGGDGLPLASNNVKVAFDNAGNLYLVYLELGTYAVDLLRTSDPSQPWSTANLIYKTIHGIDASASAHFDYPGLAIGPDSIWIAYNGPEGVEATGASLDNGVVGSFRDPVIVDPDGHYSTIAMGPDGHVVVADLNGSGRIVAANIDPNAPPGTGFALSEAAATNVKGGAFDIPAQEQIDTVPGLAWDTSTRFGPQGRLYLSYTDSPDDISTATFVVVISSDDGGATWSSPVPVTPVKQANSSQFLPSIAVDPSTGNVAVSWYDTSIDPADHTLTQVAVAISQDGGQHFTTGLASSNVSDPIWGQLDQHSLNVQYGDWAGLAFVNGVAYPAWVEDTKPGGGFTGQFNINIAKVGIQGLSTFPTVRGQAWFQAIIDDTFALFVIPPLPDDENCDDCDYQDVLDAEQEAIDAARDAVFAAGV
ncbi:sialidase family protein, partial [Singulisphaera rosea]